MRDLILEGPLADGHFGDASVRAEYLRYKEGYPAARAGRSEDLDEEGDEGGVVALERPRIEGALLDYQADLMQQVVQLCTSPPPRNIGLVSLPTGAGKTRTAVCSVLKLMETGRAQRVLWLAPARELLEQALDTFRALWPRSNAPVSRLELLRCHILSGYPEANGAGVYLSTPQMLYQRLVKEPNRLPRWDLIVFDEAHLADAPTFRDGLSAARELSGTAVPCFGLSATPGRRTDKDTDSLTGLFGRRLLRSKLLGKDAFAALRERGVLAMLRFKSIPDADDVEKDARRAASDVRRFRATVSLCENLGRKGSTLVFSGSIDHAVALALVLRRRGVSAAWVSSRMSVSERERALRRFEAGATKVLVNKALVATGYDCPAVSDVVLTVPVRSSVLFEQMVGRAARGPAIGGNKNATVWSFDDHVGIHGAPSSYHRYALAGWR